VTIVIAREDLKSGRYAVFAEHSYILSMRDLEWSCGRDACSRSISRTCARNALPNASGSAIVRTARTRYEGATSV
jgi:hypothetical protein